MSMKNKFKSFFSMDDEEYEYEYIDTEQDTHEEQDQKEKPAYPNKTAGKQNVVSLQSVQKSSKVVLSEPRVYAEAQEIADHLKNRRAVVVNLQRIQHDQAKRIVDFLSGTVYAIGGDIQRIGSDIFLCTPDNVDVSGTISELMSEDEHQRW
ncbi:cell division protein SepF [Bacillus atrophaeus]|jgi:cell division inhibitor SepF|uniref:Cell division protein SepF n=1 Tax=Bacillus atrophaeus (strain 1942) TaxID=720555 RepID=A0ABN3ZB29_BACA1|nr:cell division protein SepF [Bacillus atrophaeus]AMR63042.1 cell division protein SepF [Bacillus subtilis subsp. globigii]ADP32052.1 cell division machinery factor [Bacillus atrophaeus 1942]AIK45624.1 cell division protein sepF [Bacillus atrophaeus subsp. globigii]EIM08786.1 cell division machinery factor [Bacillus atrophaeus C89]KFK84174.1 cell division protein sepF [Bacillus atrophaeus]